MKKLFEKIADKIVSTCVVPSLRRQGVCSESLMAKASRFTACEIIEGDYLEFGVYQGASFIKAFKSLEAAFKARTAQADGSDAEANRLRKAAWQQMRFFAFDSFQGLPALEAGDAGTSDFKKGMYACDVESVRKNLAAAGVPADRTTLVEGWFSETCTPAVAEKYRISKASIVWIDGDLYSSTRDVLRFVQDFLQDGTILIFDDWFSYRGNPAQGEQRAFFEWIESPEVKGRYRFSEYQRESWKRISFIAHAV